MSALSRRQNTLTLILMSATISTEKFAEYLGQGLFPTPPLPSTPPFPTPHSTLPSITNMNEFEYGVLAPSLPTPSSVPTAPVMFIPGYTFPVEEFYKNNFEFLLRGNVDLGARRRPGPGSDPWSDPGSGPGSGGETRVSDPLEYRVGGKKRAGEIDYDLLLRLIVRLAVGEENMGREGGGGEEGGYGVKHGDKDVGEMFKQADGCILVFLPGVPEINKTIRLLESLWGEMRKPEGPRSVSLKILSL